MLKACDTISKELEERLQYFKDETKLLEYERLDQRTRHDVEMLREVGMCPELKIIHDISMDEKQVKDLIH